ncbi:hypothetical protein ACUTQ5_07905 [Serratia sp. NA_112.1]
MSNGFQGDITAKIIVPGALSVDAKNTLYARFNALKAELMG